MNGRFVDCHSHVVPSGDDGVQSVEEGLELARDAEATGTRLLYATPHVSPQLPLTAEREQRVHAAFADVLQRAPIELRLGFELTPMPSLLDEDPRRYRLQGLEHVLVEVPFVGSADLFVEVGEWIEDARLRPVVAHPERTDAVLQNPGLADELARRGWLLQVNATSLLGRHGPAIEREGWRLVDEDLAALVASDGHRAARPARLDQAYDAVRGRVGEERALRLFDGTALGLGKTTAPPLPSRAASPGA